MEESRRNEVEDKFLVLIGDDGMAGVVPALVADEQIRLLREHIDDLPLPFVAPLGAHHHKVHRRVGPGAGDRGRGMIIPLPLAPCPLATD